MGRRSRRGLCIRTSTASRWGDMAETMHGVMTSFENVDFVYTHTVDGNTFSMDTREIKKILGGVPLNAPEVLLWLLEYLRDGENSVQIGGCSI